MRMLYAVLLRSALMVWHIEIDNQILVIVAGVVEGWILRMEW